MTCKKLFLMFVMGCAVACSTIPILGGKVSSNDYFDGEYEGEFKQSPNFARVKVKIEDGHITEVILLERGGTRLGDPANEVIPKRIIEKQSTDVDAVSGATRSSRAIMNAANNAIVQASRKGASDIEQKEQ